MHEPRDVPVLLDELAQFAADIAQALSVDNIDWHWRPSDAEWCLTEVACHLRDVEREIHQVRFRELMATENVFLHGVDSDEWAEQREYRLQNGKAALDNFVIARRQTVALLEGIEDASLWQRNGRHAFFGLTSMHELLNLVVKHDQVHRQQINRLLTTSDSQ